MIAELTDAVPACLGCADLQSRLTRAERELELLGLQNPNLSPVHYNRGTHILEEAARLTGKSVAEIKGRTRGDLVPIRFAVISVIKLHLGWSLPQIGRFMNRDHTTILHAVRRAELFAENDPWFAKLVECLELSLQQQTLGCSA